MLMHRVHHRTFCHLSGATKDLWLLFNRAVHLRYQNLFPHIAPSSAGTKDILAHGNFTERQAG